MLARSCEQQRADVKDESKGCSRRAWRKGLTQLPPEVLVGLTLVIKVNGVTGEKSDGGCSSDEGDGGGSVHGGHGGR